MIIIFDKNVDTNIEFIRSSDPASGDLIEGTVYFWPSESGNSLIFDEVNGKMKCGNDDLIIQWKTPGAMKPYMDQVIQIFSKKLYPSVKVDTNVYQDKPVSGEIVSHSYHTTDIEKGII